MRLHIPLRNETVWTCYFRCRLADDLVLMFFHVYPLLCFRHVKKCKEWGLTPIPSLVAKGQKGLYILFLVNF
jgi:hypothetical protein